MKKPILVVLAAGIGSRFGGLKQISPVSKAGDVIIDYSLFDAKKAGFERVVFIIKKEIEEDFKKIVGNRLEKHFEVSYAFQETTMIPKEFSLPPSRKKPLGTSHALLCAKDFIDAPFAIINADDFYGYDAFSKIYAFLEKIKPDSTDFAMIGYDIKRTLTENGTVTRGICKVCENNILTQIIETKNIEKTEKCARFKTENGYTEIDENATVSMNFWGFNEKFIDLLQEDFPIFLEEKIKTEPDTFEYLLPICVDNFISKNQISVKVFNTNASWYGITYKEDLASVTEEIEKLHENNLYKTPLWE